MGLTRKTWRFVTFGLTGVPLAHKRSKKDKIVRNTDRTARAMEQIAQQQAGPTEPVGFLARFKQDMDRFTQPRQQVGPPPGWYTDPSGCGGQRWWDGTRWTEHTYGEAQCSPSSPSTPSTTH